MDLDDSLAGHSKAQRREGGRGGRGRRQVRAQDTVQGTAQEAREWRAVHGRRKENRVEDTHTH